MNPSACPSHSISWHSMPLTPDTALCTHQVSPTLSPLLESRVETWNSSHVFVDFITVDFITEVHPSTHPSLSNYSIQQTGKTKACSLMELIFCWEDG